MRVEFRPVLLFLLAAIGCGDGPERVGGDAGPSETVPGPPDSVSPNAPETVGGLQARATDVDGVVADLLSAERKEGALGVTIRFRNVSGDTVALPVDIEAGYDGWRLVAEGREIPFLIGEDGEPVAPGSIAGPLLPGETRTWRGMFAAPPARVRRFDLHVPGVHPFEEVPISLDEEID